MPDMNMSSVASHAGFFVKYLLSNWALNLGVSVPFIFIPLVLYFRGLKIEARRRAQGLERTTGANFVDQTVFLLGMFFLIVSVNSPLMFWSMVYLWAHVLFHVLIMIGAPPLIAYGKPWKLMELGLPDPVRPVLARLVRASKGRGAFAKVIKAVTNPVVDLIYFNVVMWMWFYPPMMTFAVDNKYVMLAMHYTFITSGMLLFTQLIDSPPYRSRVSNPVWRLGMVLVSTYSSWMLAMLMGLTHHPWFPVYFHIAGKTMSPMTDQQIGASILWVLCMEPFLYTAYYCIKLWLTMSEESKFPERMMPLMKRVRRVKSEHELLGGGSIESGSIDVASLDGLDNLAPKEWS